MMPEEDAPDEGNEYADIIKGMKDRAASTAPLQQSFFAAQEIGPEKSQRAIELSKKTGIPAAVILDNMEEVQKRVAQPKESEYADIIRRAPKTGGWMRDPLNAGALQDDRDKLVKFEELTKQIERQSPLFRPLSEDELTKQAETAAERRTELMLKEDRSKPITVMGGHSSMQIELPPLPDRATLKAQNLARELAVRRGENEFIESDEAMDTGEVMGKRFRENPIFYVPILGQVPDLANAANVYQMAKRAEAGEATPDDIDTLVRLARIEAAAQRRGQTFMAGLTNLGVNIVPFVLELMATGGTSAAVKGAIKGTSQAVTRKVLAEAGSIAAQTGLAQGLRIAQNTFVYGRPETHVTQDEKGELHLTLSAEGGGNMVVPFAKAVANSLLDIGTARIPFHPAYKFWAANKANPTVEAFKTTLARDGIEAIVGGIGINEATKLAKDLVGIAPYQAPSKEEILQQSIIFGAMSAGGAALQRKRAQAELVMGEALSYAGWFKDATDTIKSMKASSTAPEAVHRGLTAIIKDSPVEFTKVNLDDFLEAYKQDANRLADEWTGKPNALEDAKDSGLIQFPTATFLQKIVETGKDGFFQGKLLVDPNVPEVNELRQRIAKLDAEMEAERKAVVEVKARKPSEGPGDVKDFASIVAKDVAAQVEQVGRKPEAGTIGKLFETLYRAFSRKGVPEEKLATSAEVLIQKGKAEGTERGRYLPKGPLTEKAIISLTKAADPSTLMHEPAHHALEMMAELSKDSEAVKADFDAFLKHRGLIGEQWDSMSQKDREPHHEAFAKQYERWLFEGVAPSAALRNTFFRTRETLTKVYGEAGPRVQVTPELRRIFERMHATDAEIEAANERLGRIGPFMEDIPTLGMSAKEAAELAELRSKAHAAATERIDAETLADLNAERSPEGRVERAKIEAEVAAVVDGRKDIRALANLEGGKKPDGSALDEGIDPVKIDPEATKEIFGKDALEGLPRRIFSKDGGLPPEVAAEYFEYSSADEMFKAFRGLGEPRNPKEAEIRDRLRALQEQRKALELVKEPLREEEKAATAQLKVGKQALANRLEAAMKAEARAQIKDITDILADIKERGGVRPSTSTERIPKGYKAAEGRGVGSDEIAQELADRGVIADAYSDSFYDFLENAVRIQKEVKEQDFQAEAKRIARETVSNSIEALIENTKQQEALRLELESLSGEEKDLKAHYAGARKRLIDDLVNQRMAERFSKLDTLPDEARKAVHNDQQQKINLYEMQWVLKNKPTQFLNLLKKIQSGRYMQEVHDYAESKVHAETWRKNDPRVWERGERDYARMAAEALEKGDWDGFLAAKEKVILNSEIYRAARLARENGEKVRDHMTKTGDKEYRSMMFKAGPQYLAQIDGFNDRFSFRNRTADQVERLNDLREFVESLADDGYISQIPDKLLNEAYRQNWKDIPIQDLLDIGDIVKNLEHLAGLKNTLREGQQKRALEEVVGEGVASIEANSTGKRPKKLSTYRREEQKKRNTVSAALTTRNLSDIARELDGFKDGGFFQQQMLRRLNDAGTDEASRNERDILALKEAFGKYTKQEQRDFSRKTFIPEIGDSLTKEEAIMVAATLGQEGAAQRYADGRGWGPEALEAIKRLLDKKDWELVKDLHRIIGEDRAEVAKMMEEETGLPAKMVKEIPIETPFGEIDGGYLPFKYDFKLSTKKAEVPEIEEAKRALRAASLQAQTRHGFREARTQGVKLPLRMDFGVIFEHLTEKNHDLAYTRALKEIRKIVNHSKVKEAIFDYSGEQTFDAISKNLSDIAAGEKAAENAIERVFGALRRGTVASTMAVNVMQFFTDLGGVTQGMKRVGAKWVLGGIKDFLGSPTKIKEMVEQIHEDSEFMRLRANTRNRELFEVKNRIQEKGRAEMLADLGLEKLTAGKLDLQDLHDFSYYLMNKSQQIQEMPVWLGAFKKAQHDFPADATKGQDGFLEAKRKWVSIANQAILDAYGGGQMKDLSGLQKGNPIKRLVLATFYGFSGRTWAQAVESYKSGMLGLKKGELTRAEVAAKWASDYALLYAIPTLYITLVKTGLTSGDDREELGIKIAKDQISGVVGSVPVLREASAAVRDQDYSGPAGLRIFSSIGRAGKKVWDGKMPGRELNQVGGILFHYPALQVQRIADGVEALSEGRTSNPLAPAFGARR
jgi:hypothetical protein